MRYLTEAQVWQLANAAAFSGDKGQRNKLLVLVLFYTAARKDAVLHITPGSLIAPDMVQIRRLKGAKDMPTMQECNIPSWLFQMLVAYVKEHCITSKQLIFDISGVRCWQIIKTLGLGLGWDITVHSLRHSRAVDVALKTGNPMIVQGVLGHASWRTSDIYVGIAREQMAAKALRGLQEKPH